MAWPGTVENLSRPGEGGRVWPVWRVKADAGKLRQTAIKFLRQESDANQNSDVDPRLMRLHLEREQDVASGTLKAHGSLNSAFPWWPKPDMAVVVELQDGPDGTVLTGLSASYSRSMGRVAEFAPPVFIVPAILVFIGCATAGMWIGNLIAGLLLGATFFFLLGMIGVATTVFSHWHLNRIHLAADRLREAFRKRLEEDFGASATMLHSKYGAHETTDLDEKPPSQTGKAFEAVATLGVSWLLWGWIIGPWLALLPALAGTAWIFWFGPRARQRLADMPYRYQSMEWELERAAANGVRCFAWVGFWLLSAAACRLNGVSSQDHGGGPLEGLVSLGVGLLSLIAGLLLPAAYLVLSLAALMIRSRTLCLVYGAGQGDPSIGADTRGIPERAMTLLKFRAAALCAVLTAVTVVSLGGIGRLAFDSSLLKELWNFGTLAARSAFGEAAGRVVVGLGLAVMMVPLCGNLWAWGRRWLARSHLPSESSEDSRFWLEKRTRCGLYEELKRVMGTVDLVFKRPSRLSQPATVTLLPGPGRRICMEVQFEFWNSEPLSNSAREALLWHEAYHVTQENSKPQRRLLAQLFLFWRTYYLRATEDEYETEFAADWYAVTRMRDRGAGVSNLLASLESRWKPRRKGLTYWNSIKVVLMSYLGDPLLEPTHPSFALRRARVLGAIAKRDSEPPGMP